MEKKRKTTEISAAKWQGSNGTAWKQIVYLLSLQDIANLCCCSSVLNSIGKVDRVPWKELSAVMNTNLRKAVWADQPTGVGQQIYRWFALHTRSANMRTELLTSHVSQAVITTQLQFEMARVLISRLCSPAKYFIFCFDAKEYAMTVFANASLYPMKLCCMNCKTGDAKACCHPDRHGVSFAFSYKKGGRGWMTSVCGGPNKCTYWKAGGVNWFAIGEWDSGIEARTGLMRIKHRQSVDMGPDDGYPCCSRMQSAYTGEDGALHVYSLEHELTSTSRGLLNARCDEFCPKTLSIMDFKL